MDKLKIITSTTREGKKGRIVADWITRVATNSEKFGVELLDLAEINLPFMNESNHPRLQQYAHEHTKAWSRTIDEADAFIIVLAEYNFGFPAPIKNALDYLFNEWKHKPVALVSYGGASGGMRSAQMLKQVLSAFSMVTLSESVAIPFYTKLINERNELNPDEALTKSSNNLLGELARWSALLKNMRQKQ